MSQTPAGLMIQKVNDVHVVEFAEAIVLDQVRIEQIRGELDQIVDSAAQPKLVISFENVTHISSAVLGVLMNLDKKVRAKHGELRLACIGGNIRQVFTITKLDKVLRIFSSTDEAVKKF